MTFRWDPHVYRAFDDLRSRPFFDLVGRVGAVAPRRVVDAGCGPGHLTAELARRWPDAEVVGFDNSAEMLEGAGTADGRVRFGRDDVRTWDPAGTDVVVCNAVLQWVDAATARAVVAQWAAALPADGWLAVQVPGNFGSPSHALMREVAAGFPAAATALREPADNLAPADWATLLLDAGLVADVWETTYLQVLDGPDPVLRWVRGTGLRPALAALSDDDAAAFEARYAARLRDAYPPRPDGRTVFPFRRLFAVGTRADAGAAA